MDAISIAATVFGLSLAAVGLGHIVAPAAFDRVTEPAFPLNTRRYTLINGGIETIVGLGLAVPTTRTAAVACLVAYIVYVTVNAVRNR